MQMRSLCIHQIKWSENRCTPTGSVGLIAATNHEIPRLIEELRLHYAHFRQTATEHSRQWQQRHSGESFVEKLAGAQSTSAL